MSFSLSPAFPLKPPPPLRSHRSDNRRPEHPAARHLDGGAAASLKPWRFGVGSGLKSREWSGRKRRRFRCEAQLGDLAPVTSAVYGSLLLGGGLFAFSRSGSKGSLAGGCTGAVLMATFPCFTCMSGMTKRSIATLIACHSNTFLRPTILCKHRRQNQLVTHLDLALRCFSHLCLVYAWWLHKN
ncbi:uncharacterized protein LOC104442312 isoform X1 [Eucalyptus grandis]|uniref:uncharacterized protein LOC104442312 isoform X1 n=1 Tax=Eucalyptus grandis TaxID=71139 RepID=UPI00192EDF6E|nr:uncharacterized protein LOC104442312 isoform X1 [Eucalyptus grandis]